MRTRCKSSYRQVGVLMLALTGVVALSAPSLKAGPPAKAVAKAAASNDNFAAALVLEGEEGTVFGSTLGATGENGEPAHHATSTINSVWYRWQAPADGTAVFDTFDTSYDTILAAYTGGSLSTLTEVASNDDVDESFASLIWFEATAGTTYYIAVDGFANETGNFALNYYLNTLPPPPPSDSIVQLHGPVTVTEGNGGTSLPTDMVFKVVLDRPSTKSVSVRYFVNDAPPPPLLSSTGSRSITPPGTRTSDYLPPYDSDGGSRGNLTIPAGQTQGTITVPIVGDGMDEENEMLSVSLELPVNASLGNNSSVAGYINDDDAPPSLTIGNATVVEGSDDIFGSTALLFPVRLNAASERDIQVFFSPVSTTTAAATLDEDYFYPYDADNGFWGEMYLPRGTIRGTIVVPIMSDLLDESNETLQIKLDYAVNATIAVNTGTGTIVDDDAPPSISVSDVRVNEGNASDVNANFTLSLSAPSGQIVVVEVATQDGTATASDYAPPRPTLVVFAPGETRKNITIPVKGDIVDEADETFKLRLGSVSNATLADGEGVCTIVDNDRAPRLRVSDASIIEGNRDSALLLFNVTLTAPSSFPISVNYATADGSAKARNATTRGDYLTRSGSLRFAPGQTSLKVSVPVLGETIHESNETFFVNLSEAINATLSDNQATGTIINDDAPAAIAQEPSE
jgi:hypothetical protein